MSPIPPISETLYIRGTFNGWGDDSPMQYVGEHCYQATLCLPADRHQFKISDRDGTEALTFSADLQKATECQLDTAMVLMPAKGIGNDLILDAPQTGLYTLTLVVQNWREPVLRIEQGGENIDAEPNRPLLSAEIKANRSPEVALVGKASPVLAPQALFDAMAIREPQSFPFVFGDNVDGCYEGQTHRFVAAGKYRHKQGWYLGTFGALVDGKLQDKTQAIEAALYPFGITHHYAGGIADTLSIFSGSRTAALRVESQNEAVLGVAPLLNLAINQSKVSRYDDCVVYALEPSLRQPDSPAFIAISADQPFSFREETLKRCPQLDSVMHLSGMHAKPVVEAAEPTTALTVYLSFAVTEQEAVSMAKAASANNGYAQHLQATYDMLTKSYLWTSDETYNRALMWSKAAGKVFVSREFGTGIWAGLPWFKDCWGRDSFIALPGITLANGDFEDAKDIITNFASMQQKEKGDVNYGRIPNRVSSATNIIYNTTDGTPWMVREIGEYLRYSGDRDFAAAVYPVVKAYIEGVETHYLDEYGLMTHRHPDTWMDAKLQGQIPWSARGNRANDIQALWFTSLKVAAELAQLVGEETEARRFTAMAEQVQASMNQLFWNEKTQCMADRVDENGVPDYRVRPNQLMLMTVPFGRELVAPETGAHVVKNALSELMFPWGVCSLTQNDPWFHPYHNNRDEYHKDAAYHNGTIWGWNAGFSVSAMLQYGKTELAYQLTKNLADQILTLGHRGTMSENLDAFLDASGELVTTGTYAQAWSVSEFHRNGYQDYLGVRPDMLQSRIEFYPHFPACWEQATAHVPFGQGDVLAVDFRKSGAVCQYLLTAKESGLNLEFGFDTDDGHRHHYTLPLKRLQTLTVNTAENTLHIDGCLVEPNRVESNFMDILGDLTFAMPETDRAYPVLENHGMLEREIRAANYLVNED